MEKISPAHMTIEGKEGEGGKYSNKFVSTFLPAATSFGSNLRAFQSNFPNSKSKTITVRPL